MWAFEHWQWVFVTIVIPLAVWVGKQVEKRQQQKQQDSSNVHAEIRKLQDGEVELRKENSNLQKNLALTESDLRNQSSRLDEHRQRITTLAEELTRTEKERDELRVENGRLSGVISSLRAVRLVLVNSLEEHRSRMDAAGVALPAYPSLPPDSDA